MFLPHWTFRRRAVVLAIAATTLVTLVSTPLAQAQSSTGSVGNPVALVGTQFAPRATIPGWREIFVDDFTEDAPTGSFANSDCNNPRKVVYTGAEQTKWSVYPDCYLDTYNKNPYRADEVLSVHHGVLDYHLREVDGRRAGANVSPLVDGRQKGQTYGRYSARIKVSHPYITGYRLAMLLCPDVSFRRPLHFSEDHCTFQKMTARSVEASSTSSYIVSDAPQVGQ